MALLDAAGRTDLAFQMAVYVLPDCVLARGDHAAALSGYGRALEAARDRLEPMNIVFQLEGLVLALSGLRRDAEALELAGAAAGLRETSTLATTDAWLQQLDTAVEQCRRRRGERRAADALARGRALRLDAAVALGLSISVTQ